MAEGYFTTAENETHVIGVALNDPSVVWDAIGTLKGHHFQNPGLGLIWDAISEIATGGAAPDLSGVINRLEVSRTLDRAGGREGVSAIWGSAPIRSSGFADAVRYVVQSSRYRALQLVGRKISSMAFPDSPEDVDARVNEASSLVRDLLLSSGRTGALPLSESADAVWEERVDPEKRGRGAVMTGFSRLDKATGGLRPHNFVILAARPGVGKTALALSFSLNAALAGKAVAYFSFEMSSNEIYRRLIAMRADVGLSAVIGNEKFSGDERRKFSETLAEIAGLPIFVSDSGGVSVSGLVTECQRLAAVGSLDLVVVDYCQLMSSDRRHENRLQEMATITRTLKQLAKSLEIPVLALSQFSRAAAEKAPKLHHLRDSGTLEQDADIVLTLDRPSADQQRAEKMSVDERRKAYLDIAKHRNGPTCRFRLDFDGRTASYSESKSVSAYPEGLGPSEPARVQEKLQIPHKT